MKNRLALLLIIVFAISTSFAKNKNPKNDKDTVLAKTFSGMKWRSIGPALVSGRIADIAVDKSNVVGTADMGDAIIASLSL